MEKEPYRPGLAQDQTLIRLLKEYQENPHSLVFAHLADRYRAQGLVAQAHEILDEGLELNPNFSLGLLIRARCYFDQKRYADCLQLLNRILRDNAENIKAERLRADVFLHLGQKKAAITSLTRILTLAPQDREAAKSLEALENLESSFQVSPEAIQQVSHDSPPPAPSHEPSGLLEDFEVASLSGILPAQDTPESGEGPEIMATTPSEGGLIEPDKILKAENTVEPTPQSSALDSDFATKTIAELYLRQGLEEKAKQVLELILKREPNNDWAHTELGRLTAAVEVVAPDKREQLMVKAQVLERLLQRFQRPFS